MTLTPAMEMYLLYAANLQQWSPNGGIYFSLWAPGKSQSGRALLKRGLIEAVSPSHNWPYKISEMGWTQVVRIKHSKRYPQ